MAVRLSAVLGGSTESWIRLQESYDLWKVRESIDTENLTRIDFDSVASNCNKPAKYWVIQLWV
jgi:plasmid maintenance system antidote protein VapI